MRIMASLKDKYSGGKNSFPIGSPGGTALRDAHIVNRKSKTNIGTLAVRGMLQTGKTYVIEKKLQRCNIPIAGISETHWKGNGHFNTSTGKTIVFSGNANKSINGVIYTVCVEHLYSLLTSVNPSRGTKPPNIETPIKSNSTIVYFISSNEILQ